MIPREKRTLIINKKMNKKQTPFRVLINQKQANLKFKANMNKNNNKRDDEFLSFDSKKKLEQTQAAKLPLTHLKFIDGYFLPVVLLCDWWIDFSELLTTFVD